MPPMPGIITSTMATSKRRPRASSSPSSPFTAVETSHPSFESRVCRTSRMTSSSSTTSTDVWRSIGVRASLHRRAAH